MAASLISFAVGMFTFDAFAFVQVTFFTFIMLGVASLVALREPQTAEAEAEAERQAADGAAAPAIAAV